MSLPKKGVYRHFKGNRYELIDFARHSETQEMMAIYRALYGEGELWVRPLSMWSEIVEKNGRSYPRFMPEEEFTALENEDPALFSREMAEDPMTNGVETDAFSLFQERNEIRKPQTEDKHALLKRVYGYDSLREGQEEVVDSILSGRDTLAILPTGAGKSICYQLPALMLEGVTLVVSPLISLMQDQVNALTQAGIPAAYLNSALTDRQFDAALNRMVEGRYRIVYVAPERLQTQRFLWAVRQISIAMVAVDEAHCISQWGQDFRPSYLEIPDFISKLAVRPKLCAFTATATERVKRDIIQLLNMQDPFIQITGFDRPNLYLSVRYTHEKDKVLLDLMQRYRGFSGIVYCGTRKTVENVCEKLLKSGYIATRYHAGLSEEERQHNQQEFIYDRIPIMVATNAFGMGIDKSNVRFVIHYNMPKDIESYYQEAGRGGRDGERADCHLLYEPRDVALQNFFIDKMGEEGDLSPEKLRNVQKNARERLKAMTNYCRSSQCLRKSILRYFGEAAGDHCQYCSNCLQPRNLVDVTAAARLFVGIVQEFDGRFGTKILMEALRGGDTERIRTLRLDRSSYYGTLRGLSRNNVQLIADALIESDILEVEMGEYPLLRCGKYADELMDGTRKLHAEQEENAKMAIKGEKNEPIPNDIDAELFGKLRQERMKISRTRSVPPYAICHDAALIDMCRKMPKNDEEMVFVKGMGERKIRAYGAAFIRIIRKHCEKY